MTSARRIAALSLRVDRDTEPPCACCADSAETRFFFFYFLSLPTVVCERRPPTCMARQLSLSLSVSLFFINYTTATVANLVSVA